MNLYNITDTEYENLVKENESLKRDLHNVSDSNDFHKHAVIEQAEGILKLQARIAELDKENKKLMKLLTYMSVP